MADVKSDAQNEGQPASALKPQVEPALFLDAGASAVSARFIGLAGISRSIAGLVLDAVLPQCAARIRVEVAETLRACAAGRREYIRNAPDHAAVDLEHEAMLLDDAARVAEGDIGPLYGWLPSWRWTPEMHAALDCTHATAPIEEDQHADR